MKISCPRQREKKTNEEVLEMVDEQRYIIPVFNKDKKNFVT